MSPPTHSPAGRRFVLVAAVAVAAAVGIGWVAGKVRTAQSPPVTEGPSPSAGRGRGELVYQVHCASCHGPDGGGDGPGAATLRPPPRDFAARPWRFAPTAEAVRKVILDGIPGTAMGSFRAAVPPADVDPLVDHVLHLATSRPAVEADRSADGQLLKDAGFVDLHGADPPALAVSDAAGKVVRVADLTGQLVLVHFWGTTCTHCLKEMPALRALEIELGGRGFTVLHVCTDADDAQAAQELAGRVVPGVRAFVDESGIGLARFEVHALPTVWLIDPAGKAIGRASGGRDWTAPAIRKLIENSLPVSRPSGR